MKSTLRTKLDSLVARLEALNETAGEERRALAEMLARLFRLK